MSGAWHVDRRNVRCRRIAPTCQMSVTVAENSKCHVMSRFGNFGDAYLRASTHKSFQCYSFSLAPCTSSIILLILHEHDFSIARVKYRWQVSWWLCPANQSRCVINNLGFYSLWSLLLLPSLGSDSWYIWMDFIIVKFLGLSVVRAQIRCFSLMDYYHRHQT
jgi:hypothetical protein